ncbi:MAG TPA: S8 family serine peptidase [archaeon]|nr:S8 family serine peptidase [archaeon]
MAKRIKNALWVVLLFSAISPGKLLVQEVEPGWDVKVDSRLHQAWLAARKASKGVSLASRAEYEKKSWRKVTVQLSGGPEPLPADGLRLLARRGDIAAGLVFLESLPRVAASPAVKFIRLERLFFPCDDLGVLSVRAARVQPKLGLTGKGVLIGVLDSGIDWRHRDFRSSDGSTRLAAILDLSESSASLPGGEPGAEGPFGGILYTSEHINDALRNGRTLRHADYLGHGTHVAGSAAASPAYPPDTIGIYGGIAGGAEIVAVKVSSTPRDSFFSEVNIMNGLSFLDSLAAALGRPYVCNMSFGGALGSHDGMSSFERFIADFAAEGLSGRALVAASGNERHRSAHSAGNFVESEGDSTALELLVNGQGSKNDELRVEIWLSTGHPGMNFSLVTPDGTILGPFKDGFRNEEGFITEEGIIFVENAFGGPDPESGDRLIAADFYDLAALDESAAEDNIEISTGAWRFILQSRTGSFDAYVYGTDGLSARFGSHVTELGTISVPGTSPELITVGAYTSRDDWVSLEPGVSSARQFLGGSVPGTLTYFSSLGPNRKGLLKPELTAPGRWIMASLSRMAWPVDEPLSLFHSPVGGKPLLMVALDSIHAAGQGTSFAAPHVAGICALLLEANPNLTNQEIKNILTSTAATDSMTEGVPGNFWGYGRANAISAARKVLGLQEDFLALKASLFPPDTLWTDTLKYEVSIDFTRSAHILNSCRLAVHWPAQSLRLLLPLDSLALESALSLKFGTAEVESGHIAVEVYSPHGLPAEAEILKAVFVPRSAASVDSARVVVEVQSMAGDLEPFELSGLVKTVQAQPVALRPVLACQVEGDINRNGKLEILDLIEMLKILGGKAYEGPCSDLDRNGGTDVFDLIELLRFLSGS